MLLRLAVQAGGVSGDNAKIFRKIGTNIGDMSTFPQVIDKRSHIFFGGNATFFEKGLIEFFLVFRIRFRHAR